MHFFCFRKGSTQTSCLPSRPWFRGRPPLQACPSSSCNICTNGQRSGLPGLGAWVFLPLLPLNVLKAGTVSFVSFGAGGDPLTPLGLPLLPGGLGLLLLRCRRGDGPWKGPPALREGACLASPGSAGFPRTLRRWTVGSGVIPCFHWFAVFLRGASREEMGQAAWSWGAAPQCSCPRSSPAPMLLVLALSPPSDALGP